MRSATEISGVLILAPVRRRRPVLGILGILRSGVNAELIKKLSWSSYSENSGNCEKRQPHLETCPGELE